MSPLAAFFLASGPKGTLACEDRPQAGFGNCLAGMYSTLLMSKLLNRTWVRSDMWAYAFARPGPNESWADETAGEPRASLFRIVPHLHRSSDFFFSFP